MTCVREYFRGVHVRGERDSVTWTCLCPVTCPVPVVHPSEIQLQNGTVIRTSYKKVGQPLFVSCLGYLFVATIASLHYQFNPDGSSLLAWSSLQLLSIGSC